MSRYMRVFLLNTGYIYST